MIESLFQKNENSKTDNFVANEKLNLLIYELRNLLMPLQIEKQKLFPENKYPILFIVGNPRSGTTLFLQWISSLGQFSFPTNVLNRFAYAPYIGALVQQLLFNPDYDFHNELYDLKENINYNSNLGKTKGGMAVSEFQHFFRNFMPNFDPEYLTKEMVNKIDFNGIKSGIASVESVFDKPFVMKAMMFLYNLDLLYSNIPNSFYIFLKREPLYNMQSILIAREKYYGNKKTWWSVKPKEYDFLNKMDVYHQVAGQVYFTNKAIENGLKEVPATNKLTIQYEKFCKKPDDYYQLIKEKYKGNGYLFEGNCISTDSFKVSNNFKLSKKEMKSLKEAYEYFYKNY